MARQSSSHREEAATQKDLKKLQQQEQRILAKLVEAREAQASAMKRFAEAQARVLLVEGRLQAIRARMQTSQPSPNQSREASSSPTGEPDTAAPGTQTTSPEAAAPSSREREIDYHPQHALVLEPSRQRSKQPTHEVELLSLMDSMATGIPIETLPQTDALPAPDVLAEDQEDTARRIALAPQQSEQNQEKVTHRAAFPPTPPATPTPQEKRRDREEEDALIAAISALTHSQTDMQGESTGGARQAIQQAEQVLNEINLAILNGTLSGPEADQALREAEANVGQARARLAQTAPSSTQRPGTQPAGEPDITDKLPVMHDRDARAQEPM